MKLILRFLKPHWKLCVITIVLLIVDVAGGLFIPTLVAEMLNDGTSGASFDAIVRTGLQMYLGLTPEEMEQLQEAEYQEDYQAFVPEIREEVEQNGAE